MSVPIVLFCGLGVLFTYLRLMEPFRESKWFYGVGCAVFTLTAIWAGSRADFSGVGGSDVFGALAVFMPFIGAGLCWFFFFNGAMAFLLFSTARAMLGLDRIKELCSFDQAEAAERRQDFARAEQLYREAMGRLPDRHEPHLRLADLLVKQKRLAEATDQLRLAIRKLPDQDLEFRATLTFRLVEVLEMANDLTEARKVLEHFGQTAEGTRFADYAKSRLARFS